MWTNNVSAVFYSERPKRNFTETEPKPKHGLFTEPKPNRNRNSIPKLYYKYVLSIFKEQQKMPPLPALGHQDMEYGKIVCSFVSLVAILAV